MLKRHMLTLICLEHVYSRTHNTRKNWKKKKKRVERARRWKRRRWGRGRREKKRFTIKITSCWCTSKLLNTSWHSTTLQLTRRSTEQSMNERQLTDAIGCGVRCVCVCMCLRRSVHWQHKMKCFFLFYYFNYFGFSWCHRQIKIVSSPFNV